MATKAERFRSEAQRVGMSATKRRKREAAEGAALRGPSIGRKATVAFEETPTSVRPPRKSTRKSKNRQKGATALTGRTLLAKATPHNRHDQGRPAPRPRGRR